MNFEEIAAKIEAEKSTLEIKLLECAKVLCLSEDELNFEKISGELNKMKRLYEYKIDQLQNDNVLLRKVRNGLDSRNRCLVL